MEYKIGDKVEYISSTGEYVSCDHCGHEVWEEKEEKSTGEIAYITFTDRYYSPSIFQMSQAMVTNPDGTMSYKPGIEMVKPNPKIAFYTIKGCISSITESSIIRKIE